MSFNIKEKLEKLISLDEDNNSFKTRYFLLSSIKEHIIVFTISISIPFFYKISNWPFVRGDINKTTFLDFLVSFSGLFLFLLFTSIALIYIFYFIVNLFKNKNIIKEHSKKLLIEKELIDEFGSIDKLIQYLIDSRYLDLSFSDENIYKLMKESETIKNKRIKIKGTKETRINKIDLRIKTLEDEKKRIEKAGIVKEKETFLRNRTLQIENKVEDISINASELKDRVLSTVGGLKWVLV